MNQSVNTLIREAERLDNSALDKLIANMIALRARRSHAATKEAWLLEKINKGLPINQVKRLHTLNEKRLEGGLTDSERSELLTLVEKVEKQNATRLKYITLLAQQRSVSVRELMQQLEIMAVNG